MRLAVIIIAVLLACWALLALASQAAIADASAQRAIVQLQMEEDVPYIVSNWTHKDENGDCMPMSVTTTQLPTETWPETLIRHKLEVRQAKAEFPAAAPGECP